MRKESQTSGVTPFSIRRRAIDSTHGRAAGRLSPRAQRQASAASIAATFELLENRRLFTVTVTEGFPGFFEIDGDAAADNIDVQVSQADQTITVAGVGSFQNVQHVTIYGLGGDDTISVTNVSGAGAIGAVVLAGTGDDSITMDLDGGVWGGDGNDIIRLTDSYRAQAYGQAGDDSIFIRGACADADIRGGDGNDVIDCTSSTISVVAFGDAGNDTVYGSQYADQLYGGGGDDVLYSGPSDEVTALRGSKSGAAYGGSLGDTFDGGDDNDAVILVDSAGSPDVSSAESLEVDGCAIAFAGDLSAANTAGLAFSAVNNAQVTFQSTQHFGDLTIDGSGVAFDRNGSIVLDVHTIQMSGSARLDLADNAMIVRDQGVGSWDGSNYSGAIGFIAQGRHGGTWDGAGIVTSMPDAINPRTLTTLGIAPAGNVLDFAGGAQTASWMGQTVDASAVLIKYVTAGDANLDGLVNGDDHAIIDTSFPQQLQDYWRGDFNYDGVINGDDYVIIDSNAGR